MRTTECEIILNLEDTTAKGDSEVTTNNNSTFADINMLEVEEVTINDYGTLELNQFLLDGSKQILPDDMSQCGYALLGTDISDENLLRDSVTLNVAFTQPHKSMGITFKFANDCPESILITWYHDAIVLDNITFHPNSLEYCCENKVEGYNALTIVFSNSVVPFRYLRLDSITYGANLIMGADKIKKATILEEVNPISSELSINNADFTLFDASKDFNVLNPTGKYSLITRGQRVYIKEKINDTTINMGTFYLDNWDGDTETLISFNAVDALGMLSTTDFYKGKIYDQVPASTIIDEIMASAGWDKYEVDTDVANTVLSGYIPICTHREALQQVVFALRAVADCSRSNKIKIYRTETSADLKINYDRKFQGGKVGVRNHVSSVKVTMHEYVLGTELKQLFKGTLSAGTSLVTFSEPSSVQNISSGILGEYGINYAYITVDTESEIIINGYEYQDNASTLVVNNKNKITGEQENTISVKDATLITKYNVYLVANHLMDYYSLQREATQKFICDSETTGRWVSMKSQYGMFITGSITKMSLDLTGGFIADATFVGYNSLERDYIYTGLEAYTGEQIGVI